MRGSLIKSSEVTNHISIAPKSRLGKDGLRAWIGAADGLVEYRDSDSGASCDDVGVAIVSPEGQAPLLSPAGCADEQDPAPVVSNLCASASSRGRGALAGIVAASNRARCASTTEPGSAGAWRAASFPRRWLRRTSPCASAQTAAPASWRGGHEMRHGLRTAIANTIFRPRAGPGGRANPRADRLCDRRARVSAVHDHEPHRALRRTSHRARTRRVRMSRAVSVADCGRVISPRTALSQMHAGRWSPFASARRRRGGSW